MKVLDALTLIDQRLKILLYGKAGSHKTRTSATAALFAKTAPALMLTMGGNPRSIVDYKPMPTVVQIDKLEDFNDIYDYLATGQGEKHKLFKALGSQVFQTIIVDGTSETNRVVLDMVIGTKTEREVGNLAPAVIPRQHYGQTLSTMSYWARMFFGLAELKVRPLHVIMTALEQSFQNEGSDTVTYRPLFFGQTLDLMESYTYVVGQLQLRERYTKAAITKLGLRPDEQEFNVALVTKPSTSSPSNKDQYGRLPPVMVDPTLEKIYNAVYGQAPVPQPTLLTLSKEP